MPNLQSAKKRLRQSSKRRLRNQMRKTRCKNSRKVFFAAVEKQDPAAAEEALNTCVSIFDKAAKTGAISRAKADRNKSTLMSQLARLKNNSPAADAE